MKNKTLVIGKSELFFALPFFIMSGYVQILFISLDRCRNIFSVYVLLSLFYCFAHRRNKNSRTGLHIFLLVYFLIIIGELIRTSQLYNYSPSEMYNAVRGYFWVIFALPLYRYISKKNNLVHYLASYAEILTIIFFVRIFILVIFQFTGIAVFPKLLFEYGLTNWIRNGRIRMDATGFIFLYICVNVYLYYETKKRKYVAFTSLAILYMLLVSQSKMGLLYALLTTAIMIMVNIKGGIKSFIRNIILWGLIIGAFFAIQDILIKNFTYYYNSSTLGYRWYEIEYYNKLFQQNMLFGKGMLVSSNQQAYRLLFGNLNTQMYIDDIGVLGLLVQFGILGLIIYIGLFLYVLICGIKCLKNHKRSAGTLLIGLSASIAMMAISLNVYSLVYIVSVPFILAITAFFYHDCNSDSMKRKKRYIFQR